MQIQTPFTGLGTVDLLTVVLSLLGGAIAAWVVSFWEMKVRHSEEKRREKEEIKGLLILLRNEIVSNQESITALKTTAYVDLLGAQAMADLAIEQLVEMGKAGDLYITKEQVQELLNDRKSMLAQTVKGMEERRASFARIFEMSLSASFKTAIWDSAKVRLAQLIPADALIKLLGYYSTVENTLHIMRAITDENLVEVMKDDAKAEIDKLADALIEKGEEAKKATDLLIVRTVKPVAPYDY